MAETETTTTETPKAPRADKGTPRGPRSLLSRMSTDPSLDLTASRVTTEMIKQALADVHEAGVRLREEVARRQDALAGLNDLHGLAAREAAK